MNKMNSKFYLNNGSSKILLNRGMNVFSSFTIYSKDKQNSSNIFALFLYDDNNIAIRNLSIKYDIYFKSNEDWKVIEFLTNLDTKDLNEFVLCNKEEIHNFSLFKEEIEISICSICLNELSLDSITLSCLHEFCKECLILWVKHKKVCPLCKRKIKNPVK